MNVGPLYTTDTGSTYLSINLKSDDYLSPAIALGLGSTDNSLEPSLLVDWGDGSEPENYSFSEWHYGAIYSRSDDLNENHLLRHNYTSTGEYEITLTPSENTNIQIFGWLNGSDCCFLLFDGDLSSTHAQPYYCTPDSSIYSSMLTNVKLGDRINLLGTHMFGGTDIGNHQTVFNMPQDITFQRLPRLYGLNKIKQITLPRSWDNFNETQCLSGNESLEHICISETLNSLSTYSSFSSLHSLKEMYFPRHMTNFYDSTGLFGDCHSLEEVVIPEIVDYPDKTVKFNFSAQCKVSTIKFPDWVTELQRNSLGGAPLVSIDFNKITSLQDDWYYDGKKLKGVIDLSNMTNTALDIGALYSPDIENIIFPSTIKTIRRWNLSHFYTIDLSNTSIETFEHCYLSTFPGKIIFPNTIKTLGQYAFGYCEKSYQKTIKLPSSITTIGDYAFQSLTVDFDFSEFTSIPSITSTSFNRYASRQYKIIVPDNLYEEWIAATNWSDYADKIIKVSEA